MLRVERFPGTSKAMGEVLDKLSQPKNIVIAKSSIFIDGIKDPKKCHCLKSAVKETGWLDIVGLEKT